MIRSAPTVPRVLGLAGLLPFWILAIAHVTGVGFGVPPAAIAFALASYAATILSFLGGIRWGLAMARPQDASQLDIVASVLPQLAGWAALAFPDPWRLAGLALLLLILGPLDRNLVRRGLAPSWFGSLRISLSTGAGAALLLAALA